MTKTPYEKYKVKKEKIAEKLNNELKEIQTLCKHPTEYVIKQHTASLDNWCKSDDCYWTEFFCKYCGLNWKEEGSK